VHRSSVRACCEAESPAAVVGGPGERSEAGARYASANRMPRGVGCGSARPGAVGSGAAAAGAGL
jgi:hypothetical protein